VPYFELAPDPRLARFVESLCVSSDRGEQWPFEPIRVLPDGTSELVVSVAVAADGTAGDLLEGALYGVKTRALVVKPVVPTDNVSVRFRPGGASRLFGVPAHELTDRAASLDGLCSGGTQLERDLVTATDAPARLHILERFLLARLPDRAGDGTLDEALALLVRRRGRLSVRELARHTGASVRRLERLFRREVGVGPKRFARIVRLQRTIEALRRGGGHARVAAEAGFADQAHMVRELRALAGVTPGAIGS